MGWKAVVADGILSRFGIEVRRLPSRASGFYTPPKSCQISHLGYLYEVFFDRATDGTFVEIGAFDGITYSNTSCLAERGWAGLLVEPVPEFAAQCRRQYQDSPSIEIVEVAVGSEDALIETFVAGPLTTANPETLADYRSVPWSRKYADSASPIVVKQVTLDRLLREHKRLLPLDLLVVDVEGYEREVFDGFDLGQARPRMLIVELSDTHPQLTATRQSDGALLREIAASGYSVVFKDSINTVFVSTDLHAERFPEVR